MQFARISIPKFCLLTLCWLTPISAQRDLLPLRKPVPAAKGETQNDSPLKDTLGSLPLFAVPSNAPGSSSQPPASNPTPSSSAAPQSPSPSSPPPSDNNSDKDKPNNPGQESQVNNQVTTIFRPFNPTPTNPADPNPAPTSPPPPSGGNPSGGQQQDPNPSLNNPSGSPSSAASSPSNDSGFSTILYAGIGVGVVVLAALVGIFILRKWKFSPTERFKNKLTPDVYRQRTYESDHQFLRDLHSS